MVVVIAVLAVVRDRAHRVRAARIEETAVRARLGPVRGAGVVTEAILVAVGVENDAATAHALTSVEALAVHAVVHRIAEFLVVLVAAAHLAERIAFFAVIAGLRVVDHVEDRVVADRLTALVLRLLKSDVRPRISGARRGLAADLRVDDEIERIVRTEERLGRALVTELQCARAIRLIGGDLGEDRHDVRVQFGVLRLVLDRRRADASDVEVPALREGDDRRLRDLLRSVGFERERHVGLLQLDLEGRSPGRQEVRRVIEPVLTGGLMHGEVIHHRLILVHALVVIRVRGVENRAGRSERMEDRAEALRDRENTSVIEIVVDPRAPRRARRRGTDIQEQTHADHGAVRHTPQSEIPGVCPENDGRIRAVIRKRRTSRTGRRVAAARSGATAVRSRRRSESRIPTASTAGRSRRQGSTSATAGRSRRQGSTSAAARRSGSQRRRRTGAGRSRRRRRAAARRRRRRGRSAAERSRRPRGRGRGRRRNRAERRGARGSERRGRRTGGRGRPRGGRRALRRIFRQEQGSGHRQEAVAVEGDQHVTRIRIDRRVARFDGDVDGNEIRQRRVNRDL